MKKQQEITNSSCARSDRTHWTPPTRNPHRGDGGQQGNRQKEIKAIGECFMLFSGRDGVWSERALVFVQDGSWCLRWSMKFIGWRYLFIHTSSWCKTLLKCFLGPCLIYLVWSRLSDVSSLILATITSVHTRVKQRKDEPWSHVFWKNFSWMVWTHRVITGNYRKLSSGHNSTWRETESRFLIDPQNIWY